MESSSEKMREKTSAKLRNIDVRTKRRKHRTKRTTTVNVQTPNAPDKCTPSDWNPVDQASQNTLPNYLEQLIAWDKGLLPTIPSFESTQLRIILLTDQMLHLVSGVSIVADRSIYRSGPTCGTVLEGSFSSNRTLVQFCL
jgi:hypothetical protein